MTMASDADRLEGERRRALGLAWRSQKLWIAAALTLSALVLLAFCLVVSNVVHSAERQHSTQGS